MSDNNDTPEIPPHILARKALALTPETASLIGDKDYMREDGALSSQSQARQRASAASAAAAAKAEKYAGPYPLMGMPPAEIEAVRGKGYPDAPAMLPHLGDRTPAFVNWLWAKYPWDAAKRFGGTRCIWPTALPANWPPEKPVQIGLKREDYAAPARVYSQAEVDAMLAKASKPKRIRNRSKKPAPQPVTS